VRPSCWIRRSSSGRSSRRPALPIGQGGTSRGRRRAYKSKSRTGQAASVNNPVPAVGSKVVADFRNPLARQLDPFESLVADQAVVALQARGEEAAAVLVLWRAWEQRGSRPGPVWTLTCAGAGPEGGVVTESSPDWFERAKAWVERACAEQGVPVKVSDPVALRRIPTILARRGRSVAREAGGVTLGRASVRECPLSVCGFLGRASSLEPSRLRDTPNVRE